MTKTKEEILEDSGWDSTECYSWGGDPNSQIEEIEKAMDEYAKQEAIEFLEFATGRMLEVSLGVFVDSHGTYESMEQYYQIFLQQKQQQ